MKTWQLKNGYLEDEDGQTVVIFPDGISEENRDLVWRAPEMMAAILSFVEDCNNGSFKRKKAFDNFQQVLSKISV